MPRTKNKIVFGFDKLHWAPFTEPADGSLPTAANWGIPKRIIGAELLTLTAAGQTSNYAADNNAQFVSYNQDNGYTGDLTCSKHDEELLEWALGWVVDAQGMLVKVTGVPQKPFALLYEKIGTQSNERCVLYHCMGGKPVKNVQTNADTPVLAGESMPLTVAPMDFGWLRTAESIITMADEPEVYETFFDAVKLPIRPTEEP